MTKRRSTDEITASQTSTEAVDLPPTTAEKLLGDRPLKPVGESRMLVRFRKIPAGPMADKFGVRGGVQLDRIMVVGPFPIAEARELLESRQLDPSSEFLQAWDRWKTARMTFPEMDDLGAPHEMTQTTTGTHTQTHSTTLGTSMGFGDEEMGSSTNVFKPTDPDETPPPNEEFLEGLSLEEAGLPSPEKMTGAAAKEASLSGVSTLTLEDTQPPPSPTVARPKAPAAAKPQAPKLSKPEATDNVSHVSTGLSPRWIAGLVGVVLVAGLWIYRGGDRHEGQPLSPAMEARVREEAAARSWPEALRPKGEESLYENDSPLLAKIRPILRGYERGILALSAPDERTLRQVADPATADWEARRTASNQLAVFLLARLETDAAQEILNPVIEASPEDFSSLVNRALIRLAESELSDARQAAENALANCRSTGLCWVAHSVLGLVEAAEGRQTGVDRAFQGALSATSNNPFVYGLYLSSLLRTDSKGGANAARLVREALASDPDRLVDSPIPAPMAGHILKGQALDGLKAGSELPLAKVTSGQRAYLRWLDGRFRSNPLMEPQSQVLDQLAKESQPLSRVLYAYMLKRQKRYDLASTTLAQVLTTLDGEVGATNSWPWTLAGDLHYELARIDAAILHYQQALSRNPRDVAALHGLSMIFRGKNDVIASEARLAEALLVDPGFRPSLLRVSRLEWQRTAGAD